MHRKNPTPVRLRLIVAMLDVEFADEDPPSLPGIQVYDASADDVPTHTRGPGLSKCGPVRDERKKAAR